MLYTQSTLPVGTIIRRQYVVKGVLSKGGFGAVSLVRNTRHNRNLFALKEVVYSDKEVILVASNSLPVPSHEAKRSTIESLPTHVSQQEQPQASLPKNSRMPLVTLLALFITLLISVGVGASLWSYIGGQQHPIIAVTLWAPQARDTSSSSTANLSVQVTPTLVPVSSSYPSLAKLYTGTIHDIPQNVTTKLVLTDIQQQQGHFYGYFSGLGWSSSFIKGTITPNQHIQFTVSGDAGQVPLSFDGLILSNGSITGTSCSSSQGGQCSTYGLWSVSPAR